MGKKEIIQQIQVKITEQEVLRYLGYQKNFIPEINPEIKKIIREEIALIYPLLENKGIYQFLEITSILANGVISTSHGYHLLVNKKIIDLLENAENLFLAVVTIGPKLEQAVKEKFRQGQYLRAMVLDAAGTVAVKTAGQWLNHFIEQRNSQEGFMFSRYFEPGSGDWDIQEQKMIFEILKPETIGVTLNPSCMMSPAKSLSWILGAGHNLIHSHRDEFSCQYCLMKHCLFRKRTQ